MNQRISKTWVTGVSMKLALLLNGLIEFVEFICLSPFFPNVPFWFSWKLHKKSFFWCFQGNQKRRKGLMVTCATSQNFIQLFLSYSGWEKCGEDQNGLHNDQQKVEYVYVKQWPWCRTQKGRISETYLGLCQTSIMDLSVKIVYSSR